MKLRAILQVMTRMRDVHPEMSGPATWQELKNIITRENVLIITGPMSTPAQLVGIPGQWAILLNSDVPKRRWPYFAAHELGHLKLHVDYATGRFEPCFHMDRDWGNDPMEDDAEFFATALLMGPRQAVRGVMILQEKASREKQQQADTARQRRIDRQSEACRRLMNRITQAKTTEELDRLEELAATHANRATYNRMCELAEVRRKELLDAASADLWAMLQVRSGKLPKPGWLS